MTKTVAVIDGNSLMHRAFHAVQTPMTAKDGTPTNAVFGFLQMLLKFIELANPDAVVCAFDAGKPKFRMEELPGYKAQRPSMDDNLRVQFPVMEELLQAMHIPVVKVPGWEGDDILGTVAARCEKLGFTTLLVTGDKDACQLATDLTKIVTTKKGITDVVIYGPQEVFQKYGVTPQQFCDFLGLMGDSSDNIPGVPGIGPKNATKLLELYGTIEGIYEHIDELKGKQKENLETNHDLALLSRQIATIVCDLDFELDIEGISFPAYNAEEVEEAFGHYQLKAPLAKVLSFIQSNPTTQTLTLDLGENASPETAEAFIASAVHAGHTIGVALIKGSQETIFGLSHTLALSVPGAFLVLEGQGATEAVKLLFETAHFAVLDLKQLLQVVYPPDTSEPAIINERTAFSHHGESLSLAAYVLESTKNSYTYEGLAESFLDGMLPDASNDTDTLVQHAVLSRLLIDTLETRMQEDKSYDVYKAIDLPLIGVLACMERTGVCINCEYLKELSSEVQDELTHLAESIYQQAGEEFNIDSPKQLGHILFEVLGLPPLKKNSRGYSTDATVMRELAKTEQIAQEVLKYRELSKLKSTYLESLPRVKGADGRIHTVFHETVTATGRLSSSDPNLQNIPVRTDFGKHVRECFIPLDDNSVFMAADYSQIELRLLAHFSQDENLIQAFVSGKDFHTATAARVNNVALDEVTPYMRSAAKAVNFGIVYGQQAYGLSQTLDIPVSDAAEMIRKYFEAYPQVRAFLDSVVEDATQRGFAETMFGRKRRIPELKMSNFNVRSVGERTAMNHPMQGSAADIIKRAMLSVEQKLRDGSFAAKMLLQVHDELDFSVPLSEVEAVSRMVKEEMEGVVKLDVPLLVDVKWGPHWAAAH